MKSRPEEISSIIKQQIKTYKSRVEMKETGTVILVGDGIAKVYGLGSCMASELLEFEEGTVEWRMVEKPMDVHEELLCHHKGLPQLVIKSTGHGLRP